MSDTDATQARQDVVADVDEILEHIINANMLSMPYDVYYELFDAVAGIGVEIENLQAENAKLRELVRRYVEYTSQDRCEGCVFKLRCNDGEVDECCQLAEIRGLARKLGVEVDG